MDRQRWQQLQDLFAAARACPPGARASLLQQRSAIDPDLVQQVSALLAAE